MLKDPGEKAAGRYFPQLYLRRARRTRARSKEATIGFTVLFVVLMVGVLGGLFTLLSLAMCESMAQVGMSWLYFTIMTLLAAFLGIFGSVFNTYSTLYMAKDNDLLLSLPIPVRTIMAARLVSVYLMGLMYSAVVLLPAIIVYWVVVGHHGSCGSRLHDPAAPSVRFRADPVLRAWDGSSLKSVRS